MQDKESDTEKIDPTFVEEDPWAQLSESEKKKAERNLHILYGVMVLFIILPFIVFFFTKGN